MVRNLYLIPNFGLQVASGDYAFPRPDRDFVKELSEAGFTVTVLALGLRNQDLFSDVSYQSSKVHFRTLSEHGGDVGFLSKAIVYLKAVATLYVELRASARDQIAYIYFPGHINVVAALLCSLLGVEYGLYIRGQLGSGRVLSWLNARVISNAKFIISTGNSFATAISPLNENVTEVVPMISPFSGLLPRSNYEIEGQANLLFVGHITESKGVYDMLKAVKLLKDLRENFHLKIVGGGPPAEMERLSYEIESNHLASVVSCVGQISDMEKLAELYAEADIFVYPSWSEGFPRVIYEAMFFGLPICCTVLPGMVNFMFNDRNCLEIERQQPEEIFECVVRLLREEGLRRELGSRARMEVANYFDAFEASSHSEQVFIEMAR